MTGAAEGGKRGPRARRNATFWHRVSVRLAFVVVIAIALTSTLAGYLAFEDHQNQARQIQSDTLHLTRTVAAFQEDLVGQTLATLSALATLPPIQNGDWAACRRLLAAELQSHPAYANLAVADARGDVRCSAVPPSAPVNVADRSYFIRVKSARAFSMGEYQISRVTGTPVINFAAPVFDARGEFRDVLVAALDINWFGDLALKLQLPPGATLTVTDSAGRALIQYPDAAHWAGSTVPYADLIPAVLRGGPLTTRRTGLDGVKRIYGVARLSIMSPNTDTYVGVGLPESFVLADAGRRFLHTLSLIGAAGLLAALLALGGAAFFVQRPIDSLTAAAKRLSEGDLGARAAPSRLGGALDAVLHTFDDMAATLQQRTTALQDTESHFRALVEQSMVGVSILNAGTFLYVNDALAGIFGYRPDELIGHLGAIDVAHPDDRPLVAEKIRRRLLEGSDPIHYSFRGMRKDGAVIDVEVFGRRIVYHGRPAVMSTLLDVTAQKRAVAEQNRRIAEREVFYDLSVRLRRAQTSRDMYPIIVEQARALVGAAFVSLNLLNADRTEYTRVHQSGTPLGGMEPVFPLAGSVGEPVVESGVSRVVDDISTHTIPWWWDRSPLSQFGALAVVPVRTEDAITGTILAARLREPGDLPFTEDQVRQLEGIAEIGGIAIRRAELAESLARRVATLTALYGSAQRLAGSLDPDELAAGVVRVCVESFGLGMASLGYLSDGETAVMAAHYPADSEGLQTAAGRPLDFGQIDPETSRAIRHSDSPLILQNLAEEREHPAWERAALAAGMRSAAFFPLLSRGASFGFLALYGAQTASFTPERVEFLTAYAHQAAAALQNARLFDDADRRLRELEALSDIDRALRASLDLRVILDVLVDNAATGLRVDAVDVLLFDPELQTLSCAASRGFTGDAVRQLRLHVGEGTAGQVVLSGRAVDIGNLNGSAESVCGRHVAGEGFVSYHATPLVAKGVIKGVLEVYRRSPSAPTPEWHNFFEALAGRAAVAIENVTLFDDLRQANAGLRLSYEQTLEGWSRALDLRDRETEGHSQRVTELTVALAQAMGVPRMDLVHIRRGALLHDIGKMGVPDAILLKPGPLTDEEWAVMRRHTVYAREMLAPIAYLSQALDIPSSHHERWDGTGYPEGLAGRQIPLAARIFAVVDVWDALRSDRPYRSAWSVDAARAYVRGQAGKQFDPEVVESFLALIGGRETPAARDRTGRRDVSAASGDSGEAALPARARVITTKI